MKNQYRRLAEAELIGKVFDGIGIWEFDINRDLENRLSLGIDSSKPGPLSE